MDKEEQIKEIRENKKIIIIMLVVLEVYIYIAFFIYMGMSGAFTPSGGCTSFVSQQEKDMYNVRVKPYVREKVKGSEVIYMIEEIISQNQENVKCSGKFISINAKNIENYDNASEELAEVCNVCNFFGTIPKEGGEFTTEINGEGENDEENVAKAINAMTKLKSKINSSKFYKVSAKEAEGMYACITIEELSTKK